MNPAIQVESLGKCYRIGDRQKVSRNFRETLSDGAASAYQKMRGIFQPGSRPKEKAAIWALNDVSFSLMPGHVLGIIGRNGAGKSTLLKILSRITAPSTGFATVRGSVRSLLEVGTGFHPELTGRENIFLNGAILGMKRAEIRRRFDDIVQFAEVEQFIDTSVKHYSSGMYLRLAFAVAAHMRSEILMVDEVLAVGDAAFQKKCLGKMEEVAHDGRTILFVSHNLASMRSLCTQGLLMDHGRVAAFGDIQSVLFQYTNQPVELTAGSQHTSPLSGVMVNGSSSSTVRSGEEFSVSCILHLKDSNPSFRIFCIIQDIDGQAMAVVPAHGRELQLNDPRGTHRVTVNFPKLWLRPGVYGVYFKLLANTVRAEASRVLSESIMLDVTGEDDPEKLLGSLAPEVAWRTEELSAINANQNGNIGLPGSTKEAAACS